MLTAAAAANGAGRPTVGGPGLARRSAEALRAGLASLTERYSGAVARRAARKGARGGAGNGAGLGAIDEESPESPRKRGWGAGGDTGPAGPTSMLTREETYVPPAWDFTRPCGLPAPAEPLRIGFLVLPAWTLCRPSGGLTGNRGGPAAPSPFGSPPVLARTGSQAKGSPASMTTEERERRAEAEDILDWDTAYSKAPEKSPKKLASLRLLEERPAPRKELMGGGDGGPGGLYKLNGPGGGGRLRPPPPKLDGRRSSENSGAEAAASPGRPERPLNKGGRPAPAPVAYGRTGSNGGGGGGRRG